VMAIFPDPDLLVILDAPSELLYARKHEHSIEWLDQLRAAYGKLANEVPNSVLIDAAQPADQVLHSTAAMIRTRLVGDAQ
jgi:thymidylate kinase